MENFWPVLSAFFTFDPGLLTDPEILVRLLFQLALLLASAFFSASETSLFALSPLDLQQMRRQHLKSTSIIHTLLDQPRRLIISILCGNELVNIAAVANLTAILVTLYGDERAGIVSIIVMVPLLLVFGELTPQTIALSDPVKISSRFVARPLSIWIRFVAPLRWAVRLTADKITTRLVGTERTPAHILQEDEFLSLVDDVTRNGELGPTERTLIRHLLDAGNREVVEIMTPRTSLSVLNAELPLPEIIAEFIRMRHSRVPVYKGTVDNVVGILHVEKILAAKLDQSSLDTLTLEDFLEKPTFVPPTKKIQEMFDYFRNESVRAALVLNEFGGLDGLVTMRDVLIFIFGHLSGDVRGQELYDQKDANTYTIPGNLRLRDFNSLTHFGLSDTRMTTINGVVNRHLGRLPRIGDEVTVDNIHITVLEIKGQQASLLKVELGHEGNTLGGISP